MNADLEVALGDALDAVISSGHALLHQLTLIDEAISTAEQRKALVKSALRLGELASEPGKSDGRPDSKSLLSNQTRTPSESKESIANVGGPSIQQQQSHTALANGSGTTEEGKSEATRISTTNPGNPDEPIIIIGAGIGGLCLAQALKKAGRHFRVFERDGSLSDRPQGYRLKIEKNGSEALRATLTDSCFKAFQAACAITKIGQTDYNPINGTIRNSRSGSGLAGQGGLSAAYTVDREVFRRILMTGIEKAITFGKPFSSYEIIEDGQKVLVTFKDGSQVQGLFLVGADGVRSLVRRQMLPTMKYVDTGAICIYGKTPITSALEAEFPAKALRWMTAYVDKAPAIQSILIGESPLTLLSEPIRFSPESRALTHLPEDYVYWAIIGRKELFTDTTSPDTYSSSEAAKLSIALTEEWHESMSALLRLQDFGQCSAMPVVSAKPEIPPWQPNPRVTLLGDAIHAMSPCGGVGANTALVDAAELAKLFGNPKASADPNTDSVGMYEASMRKRAFSMIMRSFVGSKKMFDQRPFGECPAVPW